MKGLIILILTLYACILNAQDNTEIFLFNLKWIGDSAMVIGEGKNCSNSQGYDSQPFFEDNNSFLFTSMRNGKTADIYRCKTDKMELSVVSSHPDAEYSPKRGWKKNKITVVKGAEQNITAFNIDGSNPEVIAKHKDSIGYYAYYKGGFVCFILSKTPTLQYISKNGATKIIDTIPGRNLFPFKEGVYYEKEEEGVYTIRFLNSEEEVNDIVQLPEKVQDFFVDGEGFIYCIESNSLLRYHSKTKKWKAIVKLDFKEAKGISRLALSPDRSKLLVVVQI